MALTGAGNRVTWKTVFLLARSRSSSSSFTISCSSRSRSRSRSRSSSRCKSRFSALLTTTSTSLSLFPDSNCPTPITMSYSYLSNLSKSVIRTRTHPFQKQPNQFTIMYDSRTICSCSCSCNKNSVSDFQKLHPMFVQTRSSIPNIPIPWLFSGSVLLDPHKNERKVLNDPKRKFSSDSKRNDEISFSVEQKNDDNWLKKDPELKSILQDIRSDFDSVLNEAEKNTSASVSSEGSSVNTRGETEVESSNKIYDDSVQAYSYAQDIEEYGYYDEAFEPEIQKEKVLPISLERGKSGVFDLEELLIMLEHLAAENIVTFPVPPEANFCDHMVIVSAKSRRHLQAMNEELLWVHKRKKSDADETLRIEGFRRSDWCAMDMGNVVLHIFYGDARDYYDIETLWTLGPDHETETSKDPYVLSEEDLFWLEVSDTQDKKKKRAEARTDRRKKFSRQAKPPDSE